MNRLQEAIGQFSPLYALARDCGVTRLAEVTRLDTLGIPVWQAIRPSSRNLSVSQGKGFTAQRAIAGALMEAIEMRFAETPPLSCVETIGSVSSQLQYDIGRIGHRQGPLPTREKIEWSEGWFLHNRTATLVPRDLINLDFTRFRLCRPWLVPTSNGLAGNKTLDEAILHGLYEVVERHSLRVCRDAGTHRPIDPRGVQSPDLQAAFRVCRQLHIRVAIDDMTTNLDIPCYEVRLQSDDRITAMTGSASALCSEVAIESAFLEAAQSRLTAITGSRDDIEELDYYSGLARDEVHSSYSKDCSPCTIGARRRPLSVSEELALVCDMLARHDLTPIAVELASLPGLASVAFVTVPRLRL